MNCLKCGRPLNKDEIGIHRKLISKQATECMCLECLSSYFDVSTDLLIKKIEQYKKLGCTLFEN